MIVARTHILVAFALCSCHVEPVDHEEITAPSQVRSPTILSALLHCDRLIGRWRLTVRTKSWASGGALIWTTDGRYFEVHDGLRSVGASADGSHDALQLDLPIAIDFRSSGAASTALLCGATPSFAIRIYDLAGSAADCVRSGAHTAWLDRVPALSDCSDTMSDILDTGAVQSDTGQN